MTDLDRWAAEVLMGWTMTYLTDTPSDLKIWVNKEGYNQSIVEAWHPSDTATGQIWLCVEKMQEMGWNFILKREGERYRANFWLIDSCGLRKTANSVKDPNPAQAILLAAKAALESVT